MNRNTQRLVLVVSSFEESFKGSWCLIWPRSLSIVHKYFPSLHCPHVRVVEGSISLYFAIAAIVGSRSSCVPVALGRKTIMVTKILIEDVSTLLLMIKEC